ncbi:MAG: GLPGLI family protein [Chryseobacterium sp.]|nr:MAG: GLPGLI family protein [Chryseobacterium sp.]
MKRTLLLLFVAVAVIMQAQTSANRFFYELTYKPKTDSARMETEMMVLDITPTKSIYRDYMAVSQDSILKAEIEMMQKSGMFRDISKSIKQPKITYKITKTYPSMKTQYSDVIMSGFTPMAMGYGEDNKFNWTILPETAKIGEYNAQKATTDFGGRKWIAWFSGDIPFQDGPYKFYGLPGLIVKLEDVDNNFSWVLKGNKKIDNYDEYTFTETMSGLSKPITEVPRAKFEKTFSDYKKDPFGSMKMQIPASALNNKLPGQDMTLGEMMREQEKKLKDIYNNIDNPIERPVNK